MTCHQAKSLLQQSPRPLQRNESKANDDQRAFEQLTKGIPPAIDLTITECCRKL